MKKIICFILVLIIILTPLNVVRATEAIELTQASFDLLNNGVDLLSYSGSVPYGFLPFVFSSEKDYQSAIEASLSKQDIFNIDGNANILIRPLSQSEYGLLENAYVYDDDGNIVSLSDLYYGTVDNGYFTEKFYCKNDGTIVYQDSSKENPYIDVKFGGSEFSYVDWQNTYDSLNDDIESNNYNYDLDGFSNGNYSFYLAVGGNAAGRPEKASSLFIANQYQPGIVVPSINTNGQRIKHWFTNDLSLFNYEVLYGTPNTYYQMTYETGNYSYNGYNYHYYVSYFANEDLPTTPNNTFANWVNNAGPGLFAVVGYLYDSSLLGNDVVTYKKVVNNADSINFTKSYSYDALENYVDILDGITTQPSSDFDNSDAITSTNYPFDFVIDDSAIDTVLPFPDTVVIDDTPAIEYPLEDDIDASLITNNIPILSGLQNKFPFSIPWDIANLLKGLQATRTTPYIDEEIIIPGINYTWHIEYDLSDFDDTAELFRTLFLIAFIIGLAYFSYDHFFGS